VKRGKLRNFNEAGENWTKKGKSAVVESESAVEKKMKNEKQWGVKRVSEVERNGRVVGRGSAVVRILCMVE